MIAARSDGGVIPCGGTGTECSGHGVGVVGGLVETDREMDGGWCALPRNRVVRTPPVAFVFTLLSVIMCRFGGNKHGLRTASDSHH